MRCFSFLRNITDSIFLRIYFRNNKSKFYDVDFNFEWFWGFFCKNYLSHFRKPIWVFSPIYISFSYYAPGDDYFSHIHQVGRLSKSKSWICFLTPFISQLLKRYIYLYKTIGKNISFISWTGHLYFSYWLEAIFSSNILDILKISKVLKDLKNLEMREDYVLRLVWPNFMIYAPEKILHSK